MGDRNHGSLVLFQVSFKPLDTLGVEVVGRLVEKEYVRLLEKKPAKGHPALLSARQHAHLLVGRRALEGIHGPFQLGIDFPAAALLDFFSEFALPDYEGIHPVVVHRLHELHRDLVVLVQDVHRLLHTLLDHLQHGLLRVHLRLLLKISH